MDKLLSLIFLLSVQVAVGQSDYLKQPALGVHGAFFDFNGGDSLKLFGRHAKPGIALSFQNAIKKRLDYNLFIAGSFLDFFNRDNRSLGNGNKQLLLEADASVRAKLLRPGALFNPYALVGAGVSSYRSNLGIYIPAGIGCQVNFTPDLFMLINSQYRLAVTTTQHKHFFHSIGLAGTINKKRINKKLPTTHLPVTVKQPIDTDGDGILDSLDHCPTVIGFARYQGCPIPDRDGDKINDEEDLCPEVKGIAQYKGCPPPDRDQDGVEDALDKCPDIAGDKTNEGCPLIDGAVIKKVELAAKKVFFATGSFELLPKSFAPLNEVVKVLQADPHLRLKIDGHTDNVGNADKNKILSAQRATVVRQYLEKAGILPRRLSSTGYGDEKPVAENNTSDGRAANRRVEMAVFY